MTKIDLTKSDDLLPEIKRDDLDFREQLGVGGEGAVYKAHWKSRSIIVAVKKMFVLEKEAHILSNIRHKNIVQFYGVCTTPPNFCIVTEYAEQGSLYDYLSNEENLHLRFEQILAWAVDIAQGVYYLHNDAPQPILHRDLKSKNVVITRGTCKLCDFGTSRPIATTTHITSPAGTVPWMSPEMISQKSKITGATDVWSYAVVLWELLTREVPFEGLGGFRIATMIVDQNVRLAIPGSCPTLLKNLISDCWKTKPGERPNFGDILRQLNRMRGDRGLCNAAQKFLRHKKHWKQEIELQRIQLKERDRELKDKEQELHDRELRIRHEERLLRGRGRPYRGRGSFPLQRMPSSNLRDVAEWDEHQVCEWLFLHPLGLDDDQLSSLFRVILNRRITGDRLMMMTDVDWNHLTNGMSIDFMNGLNAELEKLRFFGNFPRLGDTVKKSDHEQSPDTEFRKLDIILTAGVYSRQTHFGEFRWKIFVDSDWVDDRSRDIFEDLHESNSVIQYITVCLPNQEPIKLPSPYIIPHWLTANSSTNEQNIQIIVNYTDRVSKPRNTRFDAQVYDFATTQVLTEKSIQLTVKPFIERKRSPEASIPPVPMLLTTPQGAWKKRKQTPPPPAPQISTESEQTTLINKTPSKSPMWSQIAAGIIRPENRKKSIPTPEVEPWLHRPIRAVSDGQPTDAVLSVDSVDTVVTNRPIIERQRGVIRTDFERNPTASVPRHKSVSTSVPASGQARIPYRCRGQLNTVRPYRTNSYQRSYSDTRLMDLTRPRAQTVENVKETEMDKIQQQTEALELDLDSGNTVSNGLPVYQELSPVKERSELNFVEFDSADRTVKFSKHGGNPKLRETQDSEEEVGPPPAAFSRKVHGGYNKWAWKK